MKVLTRWANQFILFPFVEVGEEDKHLSAGGFRQVLFYNKEDEDQQVT